MEHINAKAWLVLGLGLSCDHASRVMDSATFVQKMIWADEGLACWRGFEKVVIETIGHVPQSPQANA